MTALISSGNQALVIIKDFDAVNTGLVLVPGPALLMQNNGDKPSHD